MKIAWNNLNSCKLTKLLFLSILVQIKELLNAITNIL